MAFKMSCPKCRGLDYSVERDNRTFGAVAQAFELVFHCRCGKQLFGDALVKEYETQKADYDSGASRRARAPKPAPAAPAAVAPAPPRPATPRAEVQRSVVTERAEQAGVEGAWAAPVEVKSVPATVVDPRARPSEDGEECAWPGCEKIRRPNSKYCSRACSNKNARHRHKQRRKKPKKGGEEDQAAA